MSQNSRSQQAGRTSEALRVRVQPRSSQNEVVGLLEDGRVKIRLRAVPEKGKANKVLVEFLAEIVDVPPSSIKIISGASSQDKLVAFEEMELPAVLSRILAAAG